MPPRAPFRSFDDAFAWLAARTNYESMATQRYDARTYGLARVERLLDAVGRPDRAFDAVQVLGSKGKGSTATALAEILRASGRRVGLFTSPHLVDPRERIQIDGRPAPDRLVRDALASLVVHVERAARRGEPLTFFEVHTAAALLAFRAARCDAVVLEAGMGGRLDATTAADAVCKVLTSVSLDHTQHLGRTRLAITREKAAAARRGVPFVCGELARSEVGRRVARICARAGAPLVIRGREFDVRSVVTTFDRATGTSRTTFRLALPGMGSDPERAAGGTKGSDPQPGSARGRSGGLANSPPASRRPSSQGDYGTGPARPSRRCGTSSPPSLMVPLEVPLLGAHQARNAALAAVAALTARWRDSPVTLDHVRAGLSRTTIRARLDTLSVHPLVLVNGAHNPASVALLARTVRTVAPSGRRVFVFGMAADKDVRGSLRRLVGTATYVVTTSSGQARAAAPEDLAAAARDLGLAAEAVPDVATALGTARRRAGPRGVVVVTGSLYLCGACLRLWRPGGRTTIPPPPRPRGPRT